MTDDNTIDDDIATALTNAFSEREIEEVLPAGPSWNDLNETVRVEFADGQLTFLKIAADGDGSRITRECAVIDYVGAHCDVIVPSVITSEPTGRPPSLVTAPMHERSLAPQWADLSKTERTTVLRQIGSAFADVNSQQFDHHGHIVDGSADGLILDTGSWSTILVERIEMMRNLASSDPNENIRFRLHRLTPENVSELPSTDITFLLTIQHHWVGAYGVEEATRMLKAIGQKTSLLLYEPPGTMYIPKEAPILPEESISKYRNYLLDVFEGGAEMRNVELFDHVNKGEYVDRRDPLFVINTADV